MYVCGGVSLMGISTAAAPDIDRYACSIFTVYDIYKLAQERGFYMARYTDATHLMQTGRPVGVGRFGLLYLYIYVYTIHFPHPPEKNLYRR